MGIEIFVRKVEYVEDFKLRKQLQQEELEKALRKLKKAIERDNVIGEVRSRTYYRKPSEIRREKERTVARLRERIRNKYRDRD